MGSPCFRDLNNKYEGGNYKTFKLLIVIIFVKITIIMFKVRNFEFIIL
jgi:hypothetical protein